MFLPSSASYGEFNRPDNILRGLWTVHSASEDVYCWSESKTDGFCGVHACFPCALPIASSVILYSVKYSTNVSIPMSQYGDLNTLNFTFGYNFYWASYKTNTEAPLSAQVTIGTSSTTHTFEAINHAWLCYSLDSLVGRSFTNSGKTSLLKSSDGRTGYIQISINFTFTSQPGSTGTWYLIDPSLDITTETSPLSKSGSDARSTPSTSTPPASTGDISTQRSTLLSSSPFSCLILPGYSVQSVFTGNTPSNTPFPNPLVTIEKISTTSIVGGAIGGISLLSIFALTFFLICRRKKGKMWNKKQQNLMPNAYISGHRGGASTQIPSIMAHHELFLRYYLIPWLEEVRISSQSDVGNSGSNRVPLPPLISTSRLNPTGSSGTNLQEHPHQVGSRQRENQRRYGRAQPSSSSATTVQTNAPPPAYSDINGTTRIQDAHLQEDEETGRGGIENEVVGATIGRATTRAPVQIFRGGSSDQYGAPTRPGRNTSEKYWSSSIEPSSPLSATMMTPTATSVLSSFRDSNTHGDINLRY